MATYEVLEDGPRDVHELPPSHLFDVTSCKVRKCLLHRIMHGVADRCVRQALLYPSKNCPKFQLQILKALSSYKLLNKPTCQRCLDAGTSLTFLKRPNHSEIFGLGPRRVYCMNSKWTLSEDFCHRPRSRGEGTWIVSSKCKGVTYRSEFVSPDLCCAGQVLFSGAWLRLGTFFLWQDLSSLKHCNPRFDLVCCRFGLSQRSFALIHASICTWRWPGLNPPRSSSILRRHGGSIDQVQQRVCGFPRSTGDKVWVDGVSSNQCLSGGAFLWF